MDTERSTELLEPVDTLNDSVFGTVVDSYREAGFAAGYRRAANDLLADFLLLSARLRKDLSSNRGELSARRLDELAAFERQLERAADGESTAAHVYVDGGLGI